MVADHSHERHLSGGTSGASDQLPSLTPLRGVAALWVVLYHYCGTAQFLPNLDITPHSYLISKGYLAVDMFFILSGFVMAHVYRRTFSESVSKHYRGFLVARIARLYPLHVFILALFILAATASQFMTGLATGSFESIPLTGSAILGRDHRKHFHAAGLGGWMAQLELSGMVDQRGVYRLSGLPFCAAGDCAGADVPAADPLM
jgi:peptidoglycan/LPS O-acetylase OafA/YrhL